MAQIIFKFHSNTKQADVDAGLTAVKSLRDVFKVEAVFPGQTDATHSRLYIADTTATAEASTVANNIRAFKGIQYAEIAPVRKLS